MLLCWFFMGFSAYVLAARLVIRPGLRRSTLCHCCWTLPFSWPGTWLWMLR
jgi:hypothetical protein